MGNSEMKSDKTQRNELEIQDSFDDRRDLATSRYRSANQNSLYSASVESNISNDSFSYGFGPAMPTVITTTTTTAAAAATPSTQNPTQAQGSIHQGTSNSRFMSYVRNVTRSPNHGPPPRVEPISINRKKETSGSGKRNGGSGENNSSSSFSETISHFANSLISGRLKHPTSGGGDGPSGVKRRPFDDRSSSSGLQIIKKVTPVFIFILYKPF
jgi:hypothetical protein